MTLPPPPPQPYATLDWETYSEAGYVWDEASNKWARLPNARNYGLGVVGVAVYAEHPSTEILTLSYRLPFWPAGAVRRWTPSQNHELPQDLLDWCAAGGLLEAHNSMFERLIWEHVAVRKYGWPGVPPLAQWRCSMATARVNSYPGGLDQLGDVLRLQTRKDKDGVRLLKKFSVPRNPTKSDPRRRIRPEDDPEDFERLCLYCDRDVLAECAASEAMPSMTADELAFWHIDQEINARGVAVDREAVRALIRIIDGVLERYGAECQRLTGGLRPSQVQALLEWLRGRGVDLYSLDAEDVEHALRNPLPDDACRRVLKIRQATASASVKKLYAVERMACSDDRLRNLYNHHGARTGRPTGSDVQPTNLPKAGPELYWDSSGRPFGTHLAYSPWTGEPADPESKREWSVDAVETVLEIARTGSVEAMEYYFGDALLAVSGCVRPMFVAAPGHELISSDFTAIEAVVAAAISGEQWRLDAFARGDDIYLRSIAMSTGRDYEELRAHKERTGSHHELRHLGKIQELSLGFGGWIGAIRAFGAEGSDDELKRQILAWREASPNIVEMWGGQGRGFPGSWRYVPERYGLEGAAVNAVLNPGASFSCRCITYYMRQGTLVCRLPSGRELFYHQAAVYPSTRREGELAISYWTWNTNVKMGAPGWVPMETYGGRLFENVVQATAHDILRFAITNLRTAGYPTVLHVYDEIVAEVRKGFGSLEEFESIMGLMPGYATGWPIKASGGWRGHRYRKG